jgi:hypothetical protein
MNELALHPGRTGRTERLNRGSPNAGLPDGKRYGQKNAGLKAVTLIATLNPVSQVLW